MKRFAGFILLLLSGVFLSAGEFHFTVTGSAKNRFSLSKESGKVSFRKNPKKGSIELNFSAKRDFQTMKFRLKTKKDDTFSFAVAGRYVKDTDLKKQYFDWIELTLCKVDSMVLVGEGGAKDTPKSLILSKSQNLTGKLKLKAKKEAVIELKFRDVPRSKARELTEKEGTSTEAKARREKREKAAKERADERQKKNESQVSSLDDDEEESKTDSKKSKVADSDDGGVVEK